jgi:hypothetical protein
MLCGVTCRSYPGTFLQKHPPRVPSRDRSPPFKDLQRGNILMPRPFEAPKNQRFTQGVQPLPRPSPVADFWRG